MDLIDRTLLDEIPKLLGYFPVLALIGPRQIGKTTLVKLINEQIEKETIYLDLESLNDYAILENNPQWFFEQNTDKTIIIDEVQRMLSLFPLLRAMVDQNPVAGRFILLGSASPYLLAQSSETLAGRIVYREVMPINLSEAQSADISMQKHWLRGGFPKALLAPDSDLWYEWQNAFIKTYIESDLTILGLKASPIVIRKLLQMLTTVQGATVNYSNIASSMGLSNVNVQTYIYFLEHSFIVRRLPPYFINVGKRLVKSPKLYIRDSGLLHYLLGIESYTDLTTNVIAGHSWEGYIIEQIIGRLALNVQPYFYRTQNGAEIDLCLVKGNEVKATFEIKLSDNPSTSKGNTESIKDLGSVNNFIITPTSKNFRLNENWQVCNINSVWEYLKPLGIIKA